MTNYLSRDELLDLHLFALERWGGRLGIRSQDKLLSALNAPQQAMFGSELYPDVADKVAVMCFQLLKHRPFVGGNEATTLLAALRFFALNDVALEPAAVTALAQALRQVQHSRLSRDGLARLLRPYTPTPQAR